MTHHEYLGFIVQEIDKVPNNIPSVVLISKLESLYVRATVKYFKPLVQIAAWRILIT